ncbi:MAG: LuxR C-terminal-related transcriptional regulator [Planctomycetota bacterium]
MVMAKQPAIPARRDPPAASGPFTGAQLRKESLGLKEDGLLEGALVNDTVICESLTRREMQIMKSIVAGLTNKQMARTLCRSQRTIEYHRNRLMRKLKAHNSAELVRRAIAMGIE